MLDTNISNNAKLELICQFVSFPNNENKFFRENRQGSTSTGAMKNIISFLKLENVVYLVGMDE